MAEDFLNLDLLTLPIKFNARRKYLALMRTPKGLEVRAPKGMHIKDIHKWLSAQEDEIKQSLSQQQASTPAKEPSFIELSDNKDNYVFLHGEKSDHYIDHTLPIAVKQRVVYRFLVIEIQQIWLNQINALCEQLGVRHKFTQMKLKNTKSKWGHCTVKGVIQLNWLLAMAPKEIQHYVIAHEVCHLLEMNHSAKFWAWVELICPNYKQHRKWLKDNGYRMQW